MARIVMTDDGIQFDGSSLDAGPLGGAETAFASLAQALAARGHDVSVRNNCAAPLSHDGVDYAPLADGLPPGCDLYIANRGDKLLPLIPAAGRCVFWIHNPAQYLIKWRYLSKLWRRKPVIVFSGDYHARSYPAWAPSGGRKIIPYGISDMFRNVRPPDSPPGPRAIFTSNPMRSLDWLLDIWAEKIQPRVPAAELHVFSGPSTYGGHGASKAGAMTPILDKARAMAGRGVVLRGPVPKPELADELTRARVLLYRGDVGETFCLAVGESQAAGVPAVIQNVGCVAERIIDGETGFVAADDDAFADDAVRLLTDDNLWTAQSTAAHARQGQWGWDQAAAAFEELLP